MADGYISSAESDALAEWLIANGEIAGEWPVTVLTDRLSEIYEDGVASEEERVHLAELVSEILDRQDDETFLFTPADLPLTRPQPDVFFDRNEFVFTGKFLYGTRGVCQSEIEIRGGICSETVRPSTNYLVIGSMMSQDWKVSPHGMKILQAMEFTESSGVAIISEKHWESYLRLDRRNIEKAAQA
jgi:NAD-dependent DNA ligase